MVFYDSAVNAAAQTGAKAFEINGAKDVLLISCIGLAVVFAVLVLLMFIIKLVAAVTSSKNKETAPASTVENTASPAEQKKAAGSCGDICLYDVPDKTAAMIMAIVADQLGEPLNTLRFISIKEVK